MRYVDHGDGALVRQGVERERDVALGGVVLQVDSRKVHARAAAERSGHCRDFLGPLQDHCVHAPRIEALQVHFLRGGRPLTATSPQAPGAAVGRCWKQVLMPTADECFHPSAVDVPHQDPHGFQTFRRVDSEDTPPRSLSTASTTCSGVTELRQGCPGTGQTRARVFLQAASWSPNSSRGTP
ncbi:hypothetical protein D3C73_988430 [compost metagenome]